MYEIIKERLAEFKRVCVINPRTLVGVESHRIGLSKLMSELNREDAIIWDNFPDDLLNRDTEAMKEVLRIISSKLVGCLLVALKPKYLEILHNVTGISELYENNIAYERETIQAVIKKYGSSIPTFRSVYRKHIAKNLTVIAAILWQKEPVPITVLDYFKELVQKIGTSSDASLNGINEAQNLFVATKYYQHQFEQISNIDSRKNDVELLYTLKLSYEAGLNRSIQSIETLQRGIFQSSHNLEKIRQLTTWVYFSGQYYAMHDVCRDSIRFDDYVLIKIMRYLDGNLSSLMPQDSNLTYQFGFFFGNNIRYVCNPSSATPFSDQVYTCTHEKGNFCNWISGWNRRGFCHFGRKDSRNYFETVRKRVRILKGIRYSIGNDFAHLGILERQAT